MANRDARLQVDEALYSRFARHISVTSDLLLININNLDKPPLAIWLISGSFDLFGVSEFSARLPNIAASLISIAVMYRLVRRLYADRRAAWLAMLLLAVSPYDRGLSATAYTDPVMTLFILAACAAVVDPPRDHLRRSGIVAGLLIGVGFMVKESVLQWLPLIMILGAITTASNNPVRQTVRRVGWIAIGFALVTILLILWSVARDVTPDFWALNAHNNTPGRFADVDELWPRLSIWLGWLETAAALPILGWLCIPIQHLTAGRHYWRSREATFDLVLTVYTIASVALIWLVLFSPYDRYLHPVVPLLIILYARTLLAIGDRLRLPAATIGAVATLASLFLTAHLPIGGDPITVAGIDRAAVALNRLPAGSLVYENGLSWELGFYLGEKPHVGIVWEGTVDGLIAAIAKQPGYWLASNEEAAIWSRLIDAAGIQMQSIPMSNAPEYALFYLTANP